MLQVGNYRVKIDRKIAEGGFADIFRVNDTSTFSENMPFALKRMYIPAKKEQSVHIRRAFEQEIKVLNLVKDCLNVIKLIDKQEAIKKEDSTEVFLLLEYCPHGTLFDLIE